MALYQYDYDSSNWTQFFFGTPPVDSTFNHQGGLPILRIDSIDTGTSPATLTNSVEWSYDYDSATHQTYFAEGAPAVNDTFTHSDAVTTLRVDAIDAVNFVLTVSAV